MKSLVTAACLAAALGLTLAAAPEAKKAAPAADPAFAQIDKAIAEAKVNKSDASWRTKLPKPPVATFAADRDYIVHMETNKGPMTFRLLPDRAPMHVTSFIYLTRLGFYDGLSFHRVVPGFMAQGGCPLGNGTGNPGYQFHDEVGPLNKHDKPGMLSTARTSSPNSDGSQFFITFVPAPFLDKDYTVFGEMLEGMDTAKKLEAVGAPDPNPPKEPLKIVKVTVESKAKA